MHCSSICNYIMELTTDLFEYVIKTLDLNSNHNHNYQIFIFTTKLDFAEYFSYYKKNLAD